MSAWDALSYALGGLAVLSAWLVFRVASMARATLCLLGSFLAVTLILLRLGSEFLFAIVFLMVLGETMIMMLFMLAFMMNPAGLNPMQMVHQRRLAAGAGGALFVLLAAGILAADFPDRRAGPPADVTRALGHELMGPSMLVFETAGVTLLAAMIATLALAVRRGRFRAAAAQDGAGQDAGGAQDDADPADRA